MTLHLQVHGDGGDPLVVLPSFGFDHTSMAAAIEPAFTEVSGWRRLYVDLPGTGDSPAHYPPRSDAVLDAVVATIQAELHYRPFAILGWSYGGYLAAGVTRRLPDQVGGLMLVCTGFKIRPWDRDLSGVLASNPHPGWLDYVPSHLREHFSHAVGLQTGEVADRVVAALDVNAPSDEAYLASLRADGFALSDEDAATVCNAPVCFVAGQRDRVVGYASLSDALGNYNYASYTCISSAGHYLPLEQPTVFAAITRGWLEECKAFLGPFNE